MGPRRPALLIVDVQPDFLPGGALAVPGGDEILAPLAQLMESDRFPLRIATQDWHPHGHASFASAHPGRQPFDTIDLHGHSQTLWPDHCVQGSPGAALAPGLPWERVAAVVRKGMTPDVDSYSGFRNNWGADGERRPTGLAGMLRELGVEEVAICGLARDLCVLWTAEDAARAGFSTTLVWELTRPVDPASDTRTREALARCGVPLAYVHE